MSEAITAHQLANELLAGPDLPVHIVYDYGDRPHTQVAPGITEFEEGRVVYSDYHQMDKAIIDEDDRWHEADQHTKVILVGVGPLYC